MSIQKEAVQNALEQITAPGEGKSLVENNNVKNIVIFGKEVVVDVAISNPTLQAKKKIEAEISKIIKEKVSAEAVVKVNVATKPVEKKKKPERDKRRETSRSPKYHRNCIRKRRRWKIYHYSEYGSYFDQNGLQSRSFGCRCIRSFHALDV